MSTGSGRSKASPMLTEAQPARPSDVSFPAHPVSPRNTLSGALSTNRWLTRGDFLGMSLGFLLALAVSYLLGRHRIFWEDEMLGWMLLTDPSWHHMVQAWKAGADGGGFAFYLSCRAWLHLFGRSEIAFRFYSAVCFGLAFILNWITARRFYGPWIVAFALFNTYFCSPPIALHLVEGRFYGLLMLSVSLALWLTVVVTETPGRLPARFCLLLVFAHALVTTSHLLGVVYSAVVLLGMVVLDRRHGRVRPLLYLGIACTWLLLVPELPAIAASARVGKPWFWSPPLTPVRFVGVYSAFSGEIMLVMVLLGLALGWTWWRGRANWREQLASGFRLRTPVYVFSLALLLVPIAFLIEGFFAPSVFINRYLMPVAIATFFLCAEALQLIAWPLLLPSGMRSSRSAQARLRWGGAAVLAVVIGVWVFLHLPSAIMAQEDYTARLTAVVPKGMPILVENAWAFTEIIGRQHSSGVEYRYPLDWDQATSAGAPRLEVTEYNLMKNWRDVGYFSGSIVDFKQFLQQNPTFLVLEGEQIVTAHPVPAIIGNPLIQRFRTTPGYQLHQVARLDRKDGALIVWRVSHDPARTGMPPPAGAADAR